MANLLICLVALGVVAIVMSQSAVKDLTRVSGSSGDAVVKSSTALIQESCAFSDDFLFLRRLANVQTDNGREAKTYRQDFHGGIWQVSRQNYDLTKNITGFNYTKLENSLNISWADSEWQDLRKPLYSGIAAMITLERLGPIPNSLEKQAEFFSKYLSGDVKRFKDRTEAITSDCSHRAIDVAFVLDESGSIHPSEYEESINFTAEIAKTFTLGEDTVRVAVISFSTTVHDHIGFLDYNNTGDLVNAISKLPKVNGNTNTKSALDKLRTKVFTETTGSRKNAAKIAIVQTDGKSNDEAATLLAAEQLKSEGVIVFAIGIGGAVDKNELEGIASQPACTHVRMLNDFAELNSILADIEDTACDTPLVQDKNSSTQLSCKGDQSIRIDIENDMSLMIYPGSGNLAVYGSFETTKPSGAFADFLANSNANKPSVIYFQDSKKTLYLKTVTNATNGNACESTFLFKTLPSNQLKKTGASNMCIKNLELQECTEIDFIRSGAFAKVNTAGSRINQHCQKEGSGYHPHPDSNEKFVYCEPEAEAYVVDCPQGVAYVPDLNDCAAPRSLSDACTVCSDNNWEVGLRRFPILNSKESYVQCDVSNDCSIQKCSTDYMPKDQLCASRKAKNLAPTVVMSRSLVYVVTAIFFCYV